MRSEITVLAISPTISHRSPAFVVIKDTYLQFQVIGCIIVKIKKLRQPLYHKGCRNFTSPWGNEDTQQLIDILDKYNIKVTFFVVGDWVDRYPDSVKALHDAGHEVMNHSNDHAHFNTLSSAQIIQNINDCNRKIEAITGVSPTLFRPPYGEYNDHVVSMVRSMGMEPIQWDVEASETGSST
jgi:peptidoglycan/xylan/chitin deacetylase (PgdA/CDA1 family)